MKAIFFEKHGGPEVWQYGDLPEPTPKLGEALVRVKAVALNRLDLWVRNGWKGLRLPFPHITGSDIAGELIATNGECSIPIGTAVVVNPGVTTVEDEWTRQGLDSLSPGYSIIGEHRQGGMAELATVPIRNLFEAPENISFEKLAAPLLVGTTCWRMLFRQGRLKPGESVLVVGAGGGVNSLAIQICKAIGATVYALTSSAEKIAKTQAIGADQVINYREQPEWQIEILKQTKGRGVDLVIDNVGAATFSKSLRTVARGGRIVTVGNTSGHEITFDNRLLFTKQVSVIGSTMGSKQDFINAMEFLLQKKIVPIVDHFEPLSAGLKMLTLLESGDQFGKIVLKP